MRSISCVTDYRIRQPADEVEIYLRKKAVVRQQQEKRMMIEERPMDRFNDLTLMMEDPLGGDISIICSSSPTKTSYSQWKKQTQKRSVLPNLTIL
jgi:hypothetical protein